MEAQVAKLSGGEQSRLLLAKLMLNEANLLVLDEPTNDLDMATLDVLADVLQEFKGAILLVTHDRYFLDQITNQIIAFGQDKNKSKKLFTMVGLEQWEDWHEEQVQLQKVMKKDSQSPRVTSSKNKKRTYKDQRELDAMEETIQKAESKLASLLNDSLSSSQDPERLLEITQEMADVQKEIDRLYLRWAELEET
jgi:ATP-binding cassette subfamily F protein uup